LKKLTHRRIFITETQTVPHKIRHYNRTAKLPESLRAKLQKDTKENKTDGGRIKNGSPSEVVLYHEIYFSHGVC
jgi:hypothetical protein